MEMYGGEEVEISSDTGAIANDIFTNPTTLTTLTGLHAQTSRMMQHPDWDSILCTAETGQWLLQGEWPDLITGKGAALAVVIADETHSDRLLKVFGESLGDRVRWLPWWLHNRHMTVLLRDGKAVRAIFFERRLRTSHISPLWLEGTDADIAMEVFVAYWIKANQYKKEVDGEIEIRREHVRSESKRLISDLYKNRKTGQL